MHKKIFSMLCCDPHFYLVNKSRLHSKLEKTSQHPLLSPQLTTKPVSNSCWNRAPWHHGVSGQAGNALRKNISWMGTLRWDCVLGTARSCGLGAVAAGALQGIPAAPLGVQLQPSRQSERQLLTGLHLLTLLVTHGKETRYV